MEAKEEKVISKETAETLKLPFDKFQRYKVVADIINKFRKNKEIFKILEIGAGSEATLKKFLPQDTFIFLDKELLPGDRQKSNYILGDITMMHIVESYDFVVSIDTYEHIHPSLREKFITEIILPSNIATIVAAPFDTPGVKECEVIVNEAYVLTYDTEYRWLHEHIQNGLPSLSYTLKLIEKLELDHTVIPNGYLPRWFEMISIYLLTEGMPEFSKIIDELSELYNKNLYQYDGISPAYRQVIIIKKEGKNPDFSDILTRDFNSEDFKIKYELLQSVLRKIKELYNPYRYNQIKTLETNLQEKDRLINEFNVVVQGKNEQILILEDQITNSHSQVDEKERQIKDLNAAIYEKNERILNLEGQITDISGKLTEKERQINDLNAAIYEKNERILNLEGQITDISGKLTEKERQINDLNVAIQGKNERMKNLEGQITDISGQLTEKERQINDLNVAVLGKSERIRKLDEQITDSSGQLIEKEQQINGLKVAIRDKEGKIKNLEGEITKILQLKSIRLHRKIENIKKKLLGRQK